MERGELGKLKSGCRRTTKGSGHGRSKWPRDLEIPSGSRDLGFGNSECWKTTPKESATHGHHNNAEASGRTELQNWNGSYPLPLSA